MIRSFKGKKTGWLWHLDKVRSVDSRVQKVALRKLAQIHAARFLESLRVPPGDRLEQLRGDRSGQHSIRVNEQPRICFTWTEGGPEDVELVDYH